MSEYILIHHGIAGMKWGKRNGPPYPLGASDHSKAERAGEYRYGREDSNGHLIKSTTPEARAEKRLSKAQYRADKAEAKSRVKIAKSNVKAAKYEAKRAKTEYKQSDAYQKQKEANKQKLQTALKIGAAAAAAGLAVYGAYKFDQFVKDKAYEKLYSKGEAAATLHLNKSSEWAKEASRLTSERDSLISNTAKNYSSAISELGSSTSTKSMAERGDDYRRALQDKENLGKNVSKLNRLADKATKNKAASLDIYNQKHDEAIAKAKEGSSTFKSSVKTLLTREKKDEPAVPKLLSAKEAKRVYKKDNKSNKKAYEVAKKQAATNYANAKAASKSSKLLSAKDAKRVYKATNKSNRDSYKAASKQIATTYANTKAANKAVKKFNANARKKLR